MPKFCAVVAAVVLTMSPVLHCGDGSSRAVPGIVAGGGAASRPPAGGAPVTNKNSPVVRCGYYRNSAASTYDICNGQTNNWIR